MTSDLFLSDYLAVPAREALLVCDLFKVDKSDTANLSISYVSDDFKNWFGALTVPAHPGSTLKTYTLARYAYDSEIILALGGEEKVETSLSEIYSLMEQSPHGQNGPLLTDGSVNSFYVRDSCNALRAVVVYWWRYGWDVRARELVNAGWYRGRRIFVRQSTCS